MPSLSYDTNHDFAKANGVWRYAGTVVTTKSNEDTTTPFWNRSFTVTLASLDNDDTLTFTPIDPALTRAIVLTAKAVVANENQWLNGAVSDADDAANLKAAIEAHSVLAGLCSVSISSATLTVSARNDAGGIYTVTGSDADVTVARGVLWGRSLAGKTLLVQAAGDTRVGFGRSSADAISQADSTNGFLLAGDASRVVHCRGDITHVASTGASLRVYELLG